MYKISLKAKINFASKKLFNVPTRNLISHSPVNTAKKTPKLNLFHLHGDIQANTGIITLNRDHKYNTLSPTMMKELTRFLESFNIEESVRGIWLTAKNSDVFSKGTDFKLLHHSVLNKKPETAYNYLQKLYDFGVYMGKYNKPILLNLKGEISSSAATIFTSLPFSLANKKTLWHLNETGLGYIPDSGASYYLSRLEGELGTYLALTGNPMYAEDLAFSKISLQQISDDEFVKERFKVLNSEIEYPLTSLETFNDQKCIKTMHKNADEESFDIALKNELISRILDNEEDPKKVYADTIYKKKLSEYANNNRQENMINEEPRPLINHLLRYKTDVLETLFPNMGNDRNDSHLPIEAINRCFSGNTMEEIEEALKKENSPWASNILKDFNTKSLLSLKLTLRLIREGIKSKWSECLQREYRVACRRIKDKEFTNAVTIILFDKKKKCYEWKYKNFKDISQDVVESYFRPLEEDLKIPEYKPDIKPYGIYPVKNYYEELPDSARFFLNEESTYDLNLREDQLYSVKAFLQDRHFDYENPNFSTALVREKIFNVYDFLRRTELEKQRIKQMISSTKNIENFYHHRKELIAEKFSNEVQIKELINSTIARIFEEKLNEKFEKFKENCKMTHYDARRDFFLKMKYMVFNENFINPIFYQQKLHDMAVGLSLPLFFPDKDSESFLNVPNPEYSPKVFPPAKLTQFIQKSEPFDQNKIQYKVAPKEEISKFMKENKELFNNKVLEQDFYFKPTPEILKIREKNNEYLKRYLLGKKEIEFREKYIEESLEYSLRSKKLHDYLYAHIKTIDFEKMFFDGPMASYKDIAVEFLANMKFNESMNKIIPVTEADLKELQIKVNTMKEMTKEFKGEYDGNRTDLQIEGDLKYSKFMKLNESNYMKQVFTYLETDPELKKLFEPIVTKLNSPYGEEIRNRYLKLFLNIYKRYVCDILKKETQELNSAAPLLTKDGKTPFLIEKGDEFMEIFDDFINRSVSLDFHNIIMPDVLYIFSYIALIEIEKRMGYFAKIALNCNKNFVPPALNDKKPFYTRRYKEYGESVVKIYNHYDIPVKKFEEIPEIIELFNNLCDNMGAIISINREKLKFLNTRLFNTYQEGMNQNYVQSEVFMEKIAANYEFKSDMENRLKKLTLEKNELQFLSENDEQYNSNYFLLDNLTPKQKNQSLYNILSNEVPMLERKYLPSGLITYLKKLEGLTARGINGKFNFTIKEYDLPKESLNIPDYFGFKDQRQSSQKWFEDKIYEYLKQFFEIRFSLERELTKNELTMLDLEILQYISPEKIKQTIDDELLHEFSMLRLIKEQCDIQTNFTENMELFAFKPIDLYKKYMSRVKNPEALNKFMAFSTTLLNKIQNEKKDNYNLRDKMHDIQTYSRLTEEPFLTPEVENYSEENKLKSILELKSVGVKIQKRNPEISKSKHNLKLQLKEEVHTILTKMHNTNESKEKGLDEDITDFLEKFKSF